MAENLRSRIVTQGVQRSPNRAMLRAVGFGDDDFEKAIIGVANGYSTITPCNSGLNVLAHRADAAIKRGGCDAADVRHHHRQRRHLDGHRGHEVFAGLARGHR